MMQSLDYSSNLVEKLKSFGFIDSPIGKNKILQLTVQRLLFVLVLAGKSVVVIKPTQS